MCLESWGSQENFLAGEARHSVQITLPGSRQREKPACDSLESFLLSWERAPYGDTPK